MKQVLETVGVSWDVASVFRLLEAGWNVSYSVGKMTASREVQQHQIHSEPSLPLKIGTEAHFSVVIRSIGDKSESEIPF